jgi:hypothetical protein
MNAATKQKVQKLDERLTELLALYPYRTVSQSAPWPSATELIRLDYAVRDLAMSQRKKKWLLGWETYELVNKRWPKLKLVKRLNLLVGRARDRLKDAGESELERIRREAFEGAPKAKRLLEHFESIQVDTNKAAEIGWQNYKQLLFKPGSYRLACDAPEPQLRRSGFSYNSASISEPSRERCYASALEIFTDDLRYEPLRDKAYPLLSWIAIHDNPDYYDVLIENHMEWLNWFAKDSLDDLVQSQKRHRELVQQRFRQRIHRLRSRFTSRERMIILAKVSYQKEPSQLRAAVTEAEYVRKISR